LFVFASAAGEPAREGERRWSVHVDNDLFAFADRDRDYTAGVAFALTGDRARDHTLSLSRWLDGLDAKTRFGTLRGRAERRGDALELGLLLFTPHDLAATEPVRDDRPYANLLYAASSTLSVDEHRGAAFQTTLSIGALGLPLAEQVHRGVHSLFGSEEPRGYDHQIADGGEPTFLYAVSRYRRVREGLLLDRPYALRFGVGGSVGYVTEANAEIAFRTDAPWWSSSPAGADVAGHPQLGGDAPSIGRNRLRISFDAGARLHVRVYNAFLEGQLRGSDVTFASHDLEPVLLHLWAGVTTLLANGLSVSYTFHQQTEELAAGRGARDFTWASIGVMQRF
jgi:hypothetical protein